MMTDRRNASAVYCFVIIVATFSVFSGVRHNEFVWDTVPFVLHNPWIVHPDFNDFIDMFTRAYLANWQPMVWLSHSLDFALFDHHAGLHHLSNVAYHCADACLVYWLSLRLLAASSLGEHEAGMTAFLSGLIFAIHPQHVQSVAWLVERKDTLYVLFTLLCLISYLWIRREQISGWRRMTPLLMFALALMAKPMAVTVPVVLLLLDVVPLNRWHANTWHLVIEKWPYWLMSLAVIAVTLHTQQMAMVSIHNLPVWVRPLTAINNSWFYVKCYLAPVDLSPFYPYPGTVGSVEQMSYWLPGVIFIVASLGGGVWLWRRGWRWPLLMVVFYLVTLLPVSGLIAVGPSKALNYYSYLSTLPIGLIVSAAVVRLWRLAGRGRPVVAGVAAFYLLSLGVLSYQQVKFWRNELTLWSRAYQLYPDSAYINRNLASAYLAIGDYGAALSHAKKSASESPMGREYLERLKATLRHRSAAVGGDAD